jgi:hypothetical protein
MKKERVWAQMKKVETDKQELGATTRRFKVIV